MLRLKDLRSKYFYGFLGNFDKFIQVWPLLKIPQMWKGFTGPCYNDMFLLSRATCKIPTTIRSWVKRKLVSSIGSVLCSLCHVWTFMLKCFLCHVCSFPPWCVLLAQFMLLIFSSLDYPFTAHPYCSSSLWSLPRCWGTPGAGSPPASGCQHSSWFH